MELIVIAHRGEAQTFIKELSLKLIHESISFYQNSSKDVGLLICGEGHFEVMTKLPYLIGKYPIKTITNLGIAGALNQNLELLKIYPIRTVYSFLETKPQFKSFSTDHSSAKLSGISSIERVINTELSLKLSHFADIVDREAWSIGRICKTHKIPFFVYKLISDFANDETECLSIKERALEFSDLLYIYYNELNSLPIECFKDIDLSSINASFTQKKRIQKLIKLLQTRYPQSIAADYIENIDLDLTQKKNINTYCEQLESKLSSMEGLLFDEINQKLKPFKDLGANVILDPKKENSDFQLHIKINSEKNIRNLSHALRDFDHEAYLKLWNGNV